MGGNALKHVGVTRKTAEEYVVILKDVWERLQKLFPNRLIQPIVSYERKESFGDLDMLICSDNLPSNWLEQIKNEFKPKELISNGGVHSFDAHNFQIDLITAPDSEFNFSATYYAHNDLGNLIGRVANSIGFKYGHNGLWKVLRDEKGEVVKKVLVTNNPDDAVHFLGYDYRKLIHGFATLEDVFTFAASSRYFHRNSFHLENRNAKDRIRDEKRPTYMAFLEWIKDKPELDKYEWVDTTTAAGVEQKGQRHDAAMQKAFLYFRKFHMDVQMAYFQHQTSLDAKKLFNGAIVGEVTGLSGKELGVAMAAIKRFAEIILAGRNFDQWVVTQTPELIRLFIRKALDI